MTHSQEVGGGWGGAEQNLGEKVSPPQVSQVRLG